MKKKASIRDRRKTVSPVAKQKAKEAILKAALKKVQHTCDKLRKDIDLLDSVLNGPKSNKSIIKDASTGKFASKAEQSRHNFYRQRIK